MLETNWRLYAACLNKRTELFFHDKGGGRFAYSQARKICGECTVIQSCFEYAMEIEKDPAVLRYGMYAGMTPSQRAAYQDHLNRNVS